MTTDLNKLPEVFTNILCIPIHPREHTLTILAVPTGCRQLRVLDLSSCVYCDHAKGDHPRVQSWFEIFPCITLVIPRVTAVTIAAIAVVSREHLCLLLPRGRALVRLVARQGHCVGVSVSWFG